jgi:hypothetical protein
MPVARSFLVRGLLAGLFAGVVAFAVAYVLGEPSVTAAIGVEAAAHQPEMIVVPRALQSTLGLLTGTALAGTTIGGVVGVLSALALGRLGGLTPRASTLMVAELGFVAVYLVPFSAYPPNPPAIGRPETIGYRTALYFLLLAISLIAVVTATLLGRRLMRRLGGWYSFLIAAAAFVVVWIVVVALLPGYDEVPVGFPATVLYDFRMASLVTQLSLWTALGLLLAELVHRLVAPTAERHVAMARR